MAAWLVGRSAGCWVVLMAVTLVVEKVDPKDTWSVVVWVACWVVPMVVSTVEVKVGWWVVN